MANWCYWEAVNLVYHGRLMHSSRGQHGCPLMMPLLCAMKREMRDRVSNLDFMADFADDGVIGGDVDEV